MMERRYLVPVACGALLGQVLQLYSEARKASALQWLFTGLVIGLTAGVVRLQTQQGEQLTWLWVAAVLRGGLGVLQGSREAGESSSESVMAHVALTMGLIAGSAAQCARYTANRIRDTGSLAVYEVVVPCAVSCLAVELVHLLGVDRLNLVTLFLVGLYGLSKETKAEPPPRNTAPLTSSRKGRGGADDSETPAQAFTPQTDVAAYTLSNNAMVAWWRAHHQTQTGPSGIRLQGRDAGLDSGRLRGKGRHKEGREARVQKDSLAAPEAPRAIPETSASSAWSDSQEHRSANAEIPAVNESIEIPSGGSLLRAEAEGFVPQSQLSAAASPFCPGGNACSEQNILYQEVTGNGDLAHQDASEYTVDESYAFSHTESAWWYDYQWTGEGSEQVESVGFPMEELNVWEYIDPKGKVHGKFSCLDMRAWFERGYFPPDLRVKYFDDMDFVAISSVYPHPQVPFASFPTGVMTEEHKDQSTTASDAEVNVEFDRNKGGRGAGKGKARGKGSENEAAQGSSRSAAKSSSDGGFRPRQPWSWGTNASQAMPKSKGGKEWGKAKGKDKGKGRQNSRQRSPAEWREPPGDWSTESGTAQWQPKVTRVDEKLQKNSQVKRQWVVKSE